MHHWSNERHTIATVLDEAHEQKVEKINFLFQGREYRARICPPQVKPTGRFQRRGTHDAARRLQNVLCALTRRG